MRFDAYDRNTIEFHASCRFEISFCVLYLYEVVYSFH